MSKRLFTTICVVLWVVFMSKAQERGPWLWDHEAGRVVELDGEWELYYGQLLSPEDFPRPSPADTTVVLPFSFHDLGLANRGHATLRIKFETRAMAEGGALYLNDILCAYRIWLDGQYLGEVGKVDPNAFEPGYRPQVFYLPEGRTDHELILQVSNYVHEVGGVFTPIYVGTTSDIVGLRITSSVMSGLTMAVLLTMAIFNLMLFSIRRKEYEHLYLGLFALIISVRATFSQEKILIYLVPDISWSMLYRIELLTLYIGLPIFLIYIHRLFTDISIRYISYPIQLAGTIISLILVLSPIEIGIYFLSTIQLLSIVAVIYTFHLAFRAVTKQLCGAWTFAVGIIIFGLTVIHDVLFFMGIIQTFSVSYFGLIAFIFLQTHLLYRRFHQTFVSNEALTERLANQNIELELKIRERTKNLTETNEELQQRQDQLMVAQQALEQKNAELALQKQRIEDKNQSISHGLLYAYRLQRSLMPSRRSLTKYLGDHFVIWKAKETVSGDFYWINKTHEGVQLAVGDCTGHGIPGALLHMMTLALLNEATQNGEYNHSTWLILENVRRRMKLLLRKADDGSTIKDGAEVALIDLDTDSGEVRFSGARRSLYVFRHARDVGFADGKEREILHIKDAQVLRLIGHKQPLGHHQQEKRFSETRFSLRSGDRIYAFTDGMTDQYGEASGTKLGKKRLLNIIAESQELSLEEQGRYIEEQFATWQGNLPLIDDATILGFEWRLD